MPDCKKCGQHFKYWEMIDGKKCNLSNRKYCLSCSPFKTHNTFQLEHESKEMNCTCAVCGKAYIWTSNNTKGHSRTKCNRCHSNSRRNEMKERAIKYKGGKCVVCGYDKCLRCLAFHHADPSEKELSISGSHCHSWEKLRKELDKCVLLCMNCHGEEHYRIDKEKIGAPG